MLSMLFMKKNARRHLMRLPALLLIVFCTLALSSCAVRQWMHDQAKVEPLESSPVFANGASVRDRVPGTVLHNPTLRFIPEDTPTAEVLASEHFNQGTIDGQIADSFPFEITPAVLERGKERYEIYCAPCHGLAGYGDGMVALRGGTPPANYHVDRLRPLDLVLENTPDYTPSRENPNSNKDGHMFDVITNGYRNMWSYGAKVQPEDRWAIIAYIRALQLSQYEANE